MTGSTSGGSVWGSSPYTTDSDMGKAARHAGLLAIGQTGSITLTEVGSLPSFASTTANGVTTSSYGSWCGVQITLGAGTPNDPCPNCTALITGCTQTDCTNSTFCTVCLSGYGVNIISGTQQNCVICSTIPDCVQCTVITACTSCSSGHYVITDPLSTPGYCALCSDAMNLCLTCTDSQTCSTCSTGYKVDSTTKKCICDVLAFSLPNCVTCSIPTICTSCTPTFYYLNLTSNLCHSCAYFDTFCVQCSD